jgi:hypothetical protein
MTGQIHMDVGEFINLLPLWGVFLLTLAVCLGAVEAGSAMAGYALQQKKESATEAPLGSVVGAMLGLLAFILAFTFGMTATRFDARKQLVLDEANAIGTTYLRASLLPARQGLEVQRVLREYTDIRLHVSAATLAEMQEKSEASHGQLWSQAKSLVAEEMDSELRSLFITSLNETINLHQSRKTVGLQQRIPGTVWLAVYVLSILSMLALGYQIGMSGMRRLLATPVLTASFSVVILLIAEIDRPYAGFVRVSQQPIADVKLMMQGDTP